MIHLEVVTGRGLGGADGVVCAVQGARETEVAELQRAARRQQQVLRLDVPVHDLQKARVTL